MGNETCSEGGVPPFVSACLANPKLPCNKRKSKYVPAYHARNHASNRLAIYLQACGAWVVSTLMFPFGPAQFAFVLQCRVSLTLSKRQVSTYWSLRDTLELQYRAVICPLAHPTRPLAKNPPISIMHTWLNKVYEVTVPTDQNVLLTFDGWRGGHHSIGRCQKGRASLRPLVEPSRNTDARFWHLHVVQT